MRADALRNQQRLLDAAVKVILEVGGHPPLDAIARRAGVGIGTLYRRYPDREALLQAAALHVLDHAITAAERALAEARTGHDALRSYLHAALDQGVGVLHLIHPLLEKPNWSAQQARITPLLQAILARGKRDRTIRADLRLTDIVIPIIRFSRLVAIGLSTEEERALARRHLDIYIAGLAASRVP